MTLIGVTQRVVGVMLVTDIFVPLGLALCVSYHSPQQDILSFYKTLSLHHGGCFSGPWNSTKPGFIRQHIARC